jgi:hypothetical protein
VLAADRHEAGRRVRDGVGAQRKRFGRLVGRPEATGGDEMDVKSSIVATSAAAARARPGGGA